MPLLYRLAGWLIWLYTALVRITARWNYHGLAHRAAALAHGRVVYALWHQDGPCFSVAMARENAGRLSVLVLGGRKLALFQGFADLEGFRLHPTSPTGAVEETALAMERVQQDIRDGCWSAITPDGPAGPPRVCKPGIVGIVRAVDGVVLPLSLSSSHYFAMSGWDRARVPLPFARIDVCFGPPIVGAAHPDDRGLLGKIASSLESCSLWRPQPQRGGF